MAEYDFRSLSPRDFEFLCRDLLQAERAITLESFSAGPDSGIDFRYRSPSGDVVVQCKHYVESGFARLLSHLKLKERQKVVALNPARYVLMTSVPLTPRNKQSLVELLRPYCDRPDDVFGRDDVNNLLGLHQEIERDHFKLWLTSSRVLDRILSTGVFSDSAALLENARRRLAMYVPNDSFDRAQQLLSDLHCCIIAGIPGIGKTTLAEVLLTDLADRHAFQVCRVAHDLEEIRSVKNRGLKQVFYFDDFLGRTALDTLRRNEDQRLVELIAEVNNVPGWRLIMTTREYILNAARQRHEAFSHSGTALATCVVSLEDYTRPIRAQILYNHIYFSDLAADYKVALLEDGGYKDVLSHDNYNPRIVQYMTQSSHVAGVSASEYKRAFLDRLAHPTMIWEHPFRHQISAAARNLLLVLATLPTDALVEDLEAAFWDFHGLRRRKYGFESSPEDWENALKEIEGTFIVTHEVAGTVVARFHSPSVEDFIEGVLAGSATSVDELVEAARFFEQYEALWRVLRGKKALSVPASRALLAEAVASNLDARNADVTRIVDSSGDALRVERRPPSRERRVGLLVEVVRVVRRRKVGRALEAELGRLKERWRRGSGEKWDLLRLIATLRRERRWREDGDLLRASWKCLFSGCEELDDFFRAAEFCSAYPEAVGEKELQVLRSRFGVLVREYAEDSWEEDPEALRGTADEIETASASLGMSRPRRDVERLNQRAEDIEAEFEYDDEDADSSTSDWRSAESPEGDVDGMFENLLRDLRG